MLCWDGVGEGVWDVVSGLRHAEAMGCALLRCAECGDGRVDCRIKIRHAMTVDRFVREIRDIFGRSCWWGV